MQRRCNACRRQRRMHAAAAASCCRRRARPLVPAAHSMRCLPALALPRLLFLGAAGGRKEIAAQELWRKDPTEVLRRAVSNMLPKNNLHKDRMRKLRIFPGPGVCTSRLPARLILRAFADPCGGGREEGEHTGHLPCALFTQRCPSICSYPSPMHLNTAAVAAAPCRPRVQGLPPHTLQHAAAHHQRQALGLALAAWLRTHESRGLSAPHAWQPLGEARCSGQPAACA